MKSLGPILLGELSPDLPNLGNAGATDARNCIPRAVGYDSLQQLAIVTNNALDSRALGAAGFKDDLGVSSATYAGDFAKLYRIVDSDWVDASRLVGGAYSSLKWRFAQWENLVYGTNGINIPQVITIGGSNFADADFADIAHANHIATVRNFLVVANLEDADGTHTDRVRWSPFNNPKGDWTPSPVTMADFQDLRGNGGEIKALIGGTTGYLYQDTVTWRMEFIGSPFVFRFDIIDEAIGTLSSGSVIRYGARVFSLAEDGFRVMIDSQPSIPIGEERIDKAVLADLDLSAVDSISSATIDNQQIIIWSYPGAGNVGGVSNKFALFNFASNKWALGDEAVEILFRFISKSTSIDGFDDDVVGQGTQSPPLYDTVDDIPGSLDDKQWAGGLSTLGAINSAHEGTTFSGPPREATFITGEMQHTAGRRTFVNTVRPLIDSGVPEVQIGSRKRQQDDVVFTPYIPSNDVGVCPFRINARYHRYKMRVIGGFKSALGLEPYGRPAGNR